MSNNNYNKAGVGIPPGIVDSRKCCPHAISICEDEVEQTSPGGGGCSSFTKNASSSLTVIPVLETMFSPPQQRQLQQDNDPSALSSSSSLEQVFVVKCTSCDKSVALLLNGKFHRIDDLLKCDNKLDGWSQMETTADKIAFYILNQIIYREYEVPDEDEFQVEYALPPGSDMVKILWKNGIAVGFYSVKSKGTLDLESMSCYSMTVLDTLFVRHSDRRKGYALSAIGDVLSEFPGENLGFSVPISLPMIKVIRKHLELYPADRMKLWEVTGCGSEGSCQILWFLL